MTDLATFVTTRSAFLFKAADEFSDHLGVVPDQKIFQGKSVEQGFIETRIEDVSAELGYVDEARARRVFAAPQPIGPDELGIFCALVTRLARDVGTDRDYLMAVAYCGTENLTKLGDVGSKRVGPFQFAEAEWNAAITAGAAKDRLFLPEDRFRWNSQAEVAALLTAERVRQLKAETSLSRDPTFAELYFAQLFGSGADEILKRQRTEPCPQPAAGTNAADLGLPSGGMSILDVLNDLQQRLISGYAEALKIIDEQPPEIRIFRVENQADPPWLAVARNEMSRGVSETPGGRNSEDIKEYFKTTDFQGDTSTAAWCGAFATFCMKKSGIQEVENSINRPGSALAAWWNGWGNPATDPHRIGTVIVLKANENRSGHVGFLVGEADGNVQLLAGNQGGHGGPDHVGVVPFRAEEVAERRWLDVQQPPAAVGGLDARTLSQRGVDVGPADELFVEKAPGVMKDLMRDFPELTAEWVAAILGNIGHECGGFRQLQQLGGGGGRGWCQWDGARREASLKFAQNRSLDWHSDQANYDYIVHELKDTSEKTVLPALQRETTLEGAVKTFDEVFERSGVKNLPSRNRYAQLALVAYNKSLT
jgi:uncharacterized protein (TIGR02594 family)